MDSITKSDSNLLTNTYNTGKSYIQEPLNIINNNITSPIQSAAKSATKEVLNTTYNTLDTSTKTMEYLGNTYMDVMMNWFFKPERHFSF